MYPRMNYDFLRNVLRQQTETTDETIVNRPMNGYETVRNIKVVSTDSFKQLEVVNKVD